MVKKLCVIVTLILGMLGVCPTPAAADKKLVAALTFAQRLTAASATSITTVESPATTSGNAILVSTRVNSTTVTVSSVTDTAGNTYARIGSKVTSSVTTLEFWYAYNITGNAANFVTANFSASVGSRGILAVEFSGVKSSADPLDTSATASSAVNVGSLTSGSFTTAEANELIVSVSNQEATGNWFAYDPDHLGVVAIIATTRELSCAFKVVTAIQSGVTVTVGGTSSAPRQLIVATFKLADSTSGGEVSHTFVQ